MPDALPGRQQQLHDLLFGKGDVLVTDLHASMFPDAAPRRTTDMQRWLGPYITALNRNLVCRRLRVEPGDLKNSYRLVVMQT